MSDSTNTHATLVIADGGDLAKNRFGIEVQEPSHRVVFRGPASVGKTEALLPFAYTLLDGPLHAPWRERIQLRPSRQQQKRNPKKAAQKVAKAARKAGKRARS